MLKGECSHENLPATRKPRLNACVHFFSTPRRYLAGAYQTGMHATTRLQPAIAGCAVLRVIPDIDIREHGYIVAVHNSPGFTFGVEIIV
jgi:hypothetical protein